MKYAGLLIVVFCLVSVLYGKKEPIELPLDATGRVYYSEVVPVEGIMVDELYKRAFEWFKKRYDITKIRQDKETGSVSTSGVIDDKSSFMGFTYVIAISYNVVVTVKDGRYKYEISSFNHDYKCYTGSYSSANDYKYDWSMGLSENWSIEKLGKKKKDDIEKAKSVVKNAIEPLIEELINTMKSEIETW